MRHWTRHSENTALRTFESSLWVLDVKNSHRIWTHNHTSTSQLLNHPHYLVRHLKCISLSLWVFALSAELQNRLQYLNYWQQGGCEPGTPILTWHYSHKLNHHTTKYPLLWECLSESFSVFSPQPRTELVTESYKNQTYILITCKQCCFISQWNNRAGVLNKDKLFVECNKTHGHLTVDQGSYYNNLGLLISPHVVMTMWPHLDMFVWALKKQHTKVWNLKVRPQNWITFRQQDSPQSPPAPSSPLLPVPAVHSAA